MTTEVGAEGPRALVARAPRSRTVGGKLLGCLKLAVGLAQDRRRGSTPAEELVLRGHRFHETSRAACELHRLDLRVRGAVPREPGVLVSNHLGFIDPLILGTLKPCAPIAKAELGAWPVVGGAAERMGAMFVDRSDAMSGASVLWRARRYLEAGVTVLNFPEGTTTEGKTMAPFKRGLFGLARHLNVPILPVHLRVPSDLRWVGDDYFLPHYLRFARRARTEVVLTVGEPINSGLAPSAEALSALTRARLEALARR